MFLQELVKRSTEDHPDFILLNTALKSVTKQATEINEGCEKAENILKTMEIARNIDIENLVVPGRKFIRMDEVTEFKVDSSHTVPHKCYLFSDLIILSTEKRSKKINATLDLDLCWIRDCKLQCQIFHFIKY